MSELAYNKSAHWIISVILSLHLRTLVFVHAHIPSLILKQHPRTLIRLRLIIVTLAHPLLFFSSLPLTYKSYYPLISVPHSNLPSSCIYSGSYAGGGSGGFGRTPFLGGIVRKLCRTPGNFTLCPANLYGLVAINAQWSYADQTSDRIALEKGMVPLPHDGVFVILLRMHSNVLTNPLSKILHTGLILHAWVHQKCRQCFIHHTSTVIVLLLCA